MRKLSDSPSLHPPLPAADELCLAVHSWVRVEILLKIICCPRDTTTLAATLSCPSSLVSKHLQWLANHGMVQGDRAGRFRVYRPGGAVSVTSAGDLVGAKIAGREGGFLWLMLPRQMFDRPASIGP